MFVKKNNTLLIASRSVICCQCVQVSESVLTFDRSNPFQCFYYFLFFLMKLRSLITRKMLPCVNHLLTWNGRPVPPCTSNHFIFVESTLHKLLCPHSCPSVPMVGHWRSDSKVLQPTQEGGVFHVHIFPLPALQKQK